MSEKFKDEIEQFDDEMLDPEDPENQPEEDDDDDFAKLLEEHLPGAVRRDEGELVDATIVAILDDSVLVHSGGREESPIPIEEFRGPKGEISVKPGDSIRVVKLGYDEDSDQDFSYTKARAVQAQQMLQEASEHGKPVRGKIVRAVKGGVLVDVGINAFMPGSQVDLFRVGDLEALIGQDVEAYVIDLDPQRGRAVLSRRQLLQERKEKAKDEFLQNVKAGDQLTGRVKDVLDFGVFVTFDGMEGLIPRSELSYERGASPEDIVKPGQEIQVKVLEIAPETGKLTLSRKRLNEDPWESVSERFPAGTSVTGKVVRTEAYGVFVQLEEGLTGLLHASDLSWDSEKKDAQKDFLVGDQVTCQVIEIDQENRRISLSLKHLQRDPWMDVEAKYPVGSRQRGTVTKLRDFGAFVKLDEFAEGLLHISDLSWEKRHNHPSEVVEEGQEIEVMVLKLDRAQRRIGLGIKQLEASPYHDFIREHPEGSVVTGKVSRIMPFGAFVDLGRGLEGLCHVSELAEHRVDSPDKVTRVGEDLTVKVIGIEANRERISLSRKAAIREVEKENIRSWQDQEKQKEKESGSLFGNALMDALKKKK